MNTIFFNHMQGDKRKKSLTLPLNPGRVLWLPQDFSPPEFKKRKVRKVKKGFPSTMLPPAGVIW